jgi:hypothetical protein
VIGGPSTACALPRPALIFSVSSRVILTDRTLLGRSVYSEKIRVLKASRIWLLNNVAWNNGIGPRFYFVGSRSRGND